MFLFNEIPNLYRLPGIYIESDPSRANNGSFVQKLLVVGQRLSTGTVAAGTPMPVTRLENAENFWGRGSMMAWMFKYILKANPTVALWGIALDDLPAGVAATGSATFTGAATLSGTLVINVAGEIVRAGVASGDTQDAIAAAAVAVISAQTDYPVTAAINGGASNQIDFTARHNGEYGNDLPIIIDFDSDLQPASPAIAVTPMAGGTGNPDVTNVIAAMGDEWYHRLVMPWTDATNLQILETELTSRYSALRQIGCRAFCAFRGTYGQTQAFGDSRNSGHVTCMMTGLSPTPPIIVAAVDATVASNHLSNDPSRQLQDKVLPNVLPPLPADRFTSEERNLLLFDGISTYKVDAANRVLIEAQITMYQENAQGLPDDSLLYINVVETFERYRLSLRVAFSQYADFKLFGDEDKIPAGQDIITPKQGKAIAISHYRNCVEVKGWCEDLDSYISSVLVEKQPNRLAIIDQPNFADNFRQLFMRSEFVTEFGINP